MHQCVGEGIGCFHGDHQGSSIFEVRADLLEVFQGWISSSGIHCTAILSGDSDVLSFFFIPVADNNLVVVIGAALTCFGGVVIFFVSCSFLLII